MAKSTDNRITKTAELAAQAASTTGGLASSASDSFMALAENSKALRVNGPVRKAAGNLFSATEPADVLRYMAQLEQAQRHPIELLRRAAMSPLARTIGRFGGGLQAGLAIDDILSNGLNALNGLDATAGIAAMTPTPAAIPANGWLLGRGIGEALPDSWNHRIGKGVADTVDFGADLIHRFGK